MRLHTSTLVRILPVLFAIVLLGCSDSNASSFDDVVVIKERDVTPILATSDLIVGPNRLIVGLLDRNDRLIVDAKVGLTFYDLNGRNPVKKFEVETASVVPARESGLKEVEQHIRPDGSMHTQYNVGLDIGYYATNVNFDKAGDWGIKVHVEASEPKIKSTIDFRFNVLEQSSTPAIGSPAPPSKNLTLRDAANVWEIDSAPYPEPGFHISTVAEAIEAHRPALVFFSVPGYCSSRLCGPEYEIMRKLYPAFKQTVDFIQVEFYKDPGNPEREPVEAVAEWGLRNEPWFFVVDSKGLVTAKFEGPTSLSELQQALLNVSKE